MRADGRWAEVKALFEEAQQVDAALRERWLHDRCGADPVLFEEVRSLLAFDDRPHPLFDRTPASLAALLDDDEDDEDLPADTPIGPYRIERPLGRGGMGAVYLASRSDGEVRQRVAIKIVKRGMDTAEIVRRFRMERQTLATLSHPNIAMLLDAGRTADGMPYFVMEYVEGQPIVEYCLSHRLSDEQRLRLMLRVCAAVQHAHQHLIVHRDLKPDNVLVRADGEPKLLDFGIAKLLEAEDVAATRTAARPMTPRYASPEQVRGEAVSTVSDIYSLGVLLYELLAGRLPYGGDVSTHAGLERAICESEPVPLRIASRRRVPADLEAIVLTALRKEPERRYASVEQLADDVRRFLDGRPVQAQRDTLRYRTSKFVRRNRLVVAAASVAAVSIIAGAAAAAWQARVARHEAAVAVENANKARAETIRAERVATFLKGVLALPDPSWHAAGAGQPRDTSVLSLLRGAAARVDADLQDHPDVAADIHHTLGNTYRALGMYEEADRHYDISLTQRRQVFGDNHPKVAASLYMKYAILSAFRRTDQAIVLLREAVRIARAAPPAADMPDLLPHLLTDLSGMMLERDLGESEALATEALQIFRARYTDEHLTVAYVKRTLSGVARAKGNVAAAEALLRESADTISRLSPPNSHNVSPILEDLGIMAMERGAYNEAMQLFVDAHARTIAALGAEHPAVAHILTQQAVSASLAGRHAEAERLARAAIAILQQLFGRDSGALRPSLTRLADVQVRAGKPRDAERQFREILRNIARHPGSHCEAAAIEFSLAATLAMQSRHREALRIAQSSYSAARTHCPQGGPALKGIDEGAARFFPSLLRP